MSQKLLKASAIINLSVVSIIIFGLMMLGPIWATIGIILGIIPIGLMVASSIVFLSYCKINNEELLKRKNTVLIWGVVLIFISFITGILSLIAYSEIGSSKTGEESLNKEEPVNKEIKRLDTLLKLGVGLIALSGIMFATSSWNILSGGIKVIGLLLFSVLFFILSKFAGEKLNIKKSEITYYILGACFLVFSLVAVGYFNLFGNWLSFSGNGCNLLMAVIFLVITVLGIISFKKYNQLKLLHIVYTSGILVITYSFLQIGVKLNFILLALAILALALSLNKNEVNIYTKVLNDFGRILIAVLFVILYMIELKNLIFVNILTAFILIIASYIQALIKKNYMYKIVAPIFAILFGCYSIYSLELTNNLDIVAAVFLIALISLISYFNREDGDLLSSTFWTTSIGFLYYYVLSMSREAFIITALISVILLLINIINNLKAEQEAFKIEIYSQPLKLILLINAVSLLISSHIDNLSGNILLLSIGVVFVLGYFIQSNLKIKNIYYIGALLATILYYLSILNSNNLPSSFVAGIINIMVMAVLTIIAFKSDKYSKNNFKEVLFLTTLLISLYNIISITLNYNIELLGVIISMILFIMLSILFINNRYLFGTSLIMAGLLLGNVFDFSYDINLILHSLISFGIIFIFIHAILGNANEKLKMVLETIGLSIIFLGIIFVDSWVIGIYIGTLCIIFILKGYNNKFTAYFYTGIAFLILNILVQLKNYWDNIPSWAYIFVGGLILVGVVMYKEYRTIKPKIKEVKEEKNEEIEEEKIVKNIPLEVVVVSIVMLLVTVSNVNYLFDKVQEVRIERQEIYIDRY